FHAGLSPVAWRQRDRRWDDRYGDGTWSRPPRFALGPARCRKLGNDDAPDDRHPGGPSVYDGDGRGRVAVEASDAARDRAAGADGVPYRLDRRPSAPDNSRRHAAAGDIRLPDSERPGQKRGTPGGPARARHDDR